MNKIFAIALTSVLAIAASPAFASTTDLMSHYWIGR